MQEREKEKKLSKDEGGVMARLNEIWPRAKSVEGGCCSLLAKSWVEKRKGEEREQLVQAHRERRGKLGKAFVLGRNLCVTGKRTALGKRGKAERAERGTVTHVAHLQERSWANLGSLRAGQWILAVLCARAFCSFFHLI